MAPCRVQGGNVVYEVVPSGAVPEWGVSRVGRGGGGESLMKIYLERCQGLGFGFGGGVSIKAS